MTTQQLEASSAIDQARAALPLIQSALLQGQFEEAEHTLDIVLSILGDDADSLNLAVMAALGQGKIVEAQNFAARLLNARPDWPEALLTAAQVAIVAQDFANGSRQLDQLLRLHPDHQGAQALKAQIPAEYRDAPRPVPIAAAAAPAEAVPGSLLRGSSAELIERGKKEYAAGHYQQALEYFEHVVKRDKTHSSAHHFKAVTLMQLGRLTESKSAFDTALKLRSRDADIWNHFGSLMTMCGDHEAACKAFRKALAINPRHDSALINLARDHMQQGEYSEAESFVRKALAINPARVEALTNLGVIQMETKRHAEAAATLRKAVELQPGFAPAWLNLGVAEKTLGNMEAAETCYRRAVELAPGAADAWKNISILLEEQKRWQEADEAADRALAIAPENPAILGQKGNVLSGQMRCQEAIAYFERAIALDPASARLHSNLGLAHFHLGRHEQAMQCYRTALEIDPLHAMTWNNLGGIHEKNKELPEAIAAYQKALECEPGFAQAYNNLGYCLMSLVKLDEALQMFEKCIGMKPDYGAARSNLLFCLNYHPELSPEEVYAWYRRFGEEAERSVADKVLSHEGWNWDGQRRLRIGYLSPDFKGHACRYFMEPLFREHDHSQFELFAYSNVQQPDTHTERLKTYFDHWRDIVALSDDQAAAQIAADRIDILVDLAGHTAGNRLMVCARKPAPIQMTHMGYGYTTGLKAIDYFLCDEQFVPPGSEHLFSETPWRLPVASCYQPDQNTPQVTALPALANGYVTFGSLARTVRLNERVIAAWSGILKRVPGSKLRLNQAPFQDARTRELFWERFAQNGIGRERVILEYSTPHWPAYQQMDIALDPFPHNGGTTTMEALWMGVPVLSKRDRPPVGRLGAYMLHAMGMDDWLVDSDDAYIEEAVRRAGDIQGLAGLRAGLRRRMECSPLVQAATYTRSLEQAYRQMVMRKMKERA
ncbi:MAG: tetratricopeptide repeat protein [Bacillota bacterium]